MPPAAPLKPRANTKTAASTRARAKPIVAQRRIKTAAPQPAKPKLLMIAHNHPDFFPGGGEIFAYGLFEQVKLEGRYDPIFLAGTGRIARSPHQGTPFLSHEGRPDEYLFWGEPYDYFHHSLKEPAYLSRDFKAFLEEMRPEVIHFHHVLRFGMEAIEIARQVMPTARILYTLHDFIPICHRDGQMLRTFNNALCTHATPARCHECFRDISPARFKSREVFIKTHLDLIDVFVSPSILLAERYHLWGIPAEKIQVIENGILRPYGAIKPAKAKAARNRFGFFGQISPYKGTLLLPQAAEALLARGITDFSVSIHGNIGLQTEDYKEAFNATLARLPHHVRDYGRYRQQDLAKLMANVDWVVVPSIWWENSPLVIQEAFLHGKPVICSDVGGMAEKVNDGVTGMHFQVGSHHSLADVMARAIAEPELCAQLASNITPPPTMGQCSAAYYQLYEASRPARAATG